MNKNRIIIAVLFAAVLCFIWGNSLLSPEASDKISTAVGEFFASVFGSGDGSSIVGGLPVRKVAHFVEFCALGIVAELLLLSFTRFRRVRLCCEAFVGLLIPIIDETIQIFSGRGSSLKDVWIDIAGFILGCAVTHLVELLICYVKEKRKKQP